jgi:hypothetical protein
MTWCILVRYSPYECQVLAYTWKNQHGITFSSSALEVDNEYLIFDLPHFHCTYVILSILTFFKQTIIMLSNTHTHKTEIWLDTSVHSACLQQNNLLSVNELWHNNKNFNAHMKWLLKKIQWTDWLVFNFRSVIGPGRCKKLVTLK